MENSAEEQMQVRENAGIDAAHGGEIICGLHERNDARNCAAAKGHWTAPLLISDGDVRRLCRTPHRAEIRVQTADCTTLSNQLLSSGQHPMCVAGSETDLKRHKKTSMKQPGPQFGGELQHPKSAEI